MKHIELSRFTGSRRLWLWLNLAVWTGIFLPGMLSAQQQTFTSNTTFVVPPGVTRLTVECWGGGGAGGESTGTSETGGGGGGAYARRNSLVVTPGETLNVFVGQGGVVGGTAGKGGDTYLARNINPLVVAIGGNNGARNSQNGALGGSFAGSLGDVTYGGGNGANGSRDVFGGGGGSSAGSAANGVSATGSTGAIAPTGGGNGGNGALPASASTAGQLYGGGGGGSLNIQSQSRPAAPGANGIMLVYYSVSCIAPAISVQPLASTDLCSGASLNLSVTATGTPLNYQWKKNGTNLNGQTTSSLQIAAVSASDAGSYTVTVSNACGTITSSAAVVTVNNAPLITTQPAQAGAVCTGGTLNLSVSSSGSALSYAWFNNGALIPSTTTANLSLSNITQADAGNYTVTVSNACGSTTSNAASVNINGTVSIASQSSNLSTCQSQLIQLSVTPTGDLNSILNYAWSLNGVLQPSVTGSTNDFIADPSTAGTYTVVINTLCGPVNASPVTVTVKPRYSIDLPEVFACDSYQLPWGQIVNTTGSYSQSFIASNGCDSIVNVAVNITQPVQTTFTEVECDSFVYNGTTYTSSQTIVADFTAASGCDSTVTIFLQVNYSTSTTTTETACGSYNWIDGNTYTQSGTYSVNGFTPDGCTSSNTLVLTIIQPTISYDTVNTCGPYFWPPANDFIVSPGTFVNFDDQACTIDSLTVNFTDPYVINFDSIPFVTACGSYDWFDGTQTITYHAPLSNELIGAVYPDPEGLGCDSTVGIYLTLLPANINTTAASNCSSYTWALNGETYTQSGTYTYVADPVNAPCDQEVLDLTITPGSVTTTTIDTCGSYTWAADAQTYTQSGIYTFTPDPNNPCVIEVLDLNIGTGGINTTAVNTCSSYTWSLDGQTYTQSGSYTFNASCSIEVLELTLEYTAGVYDIITTCDSTYTWSVNGLTYNADGFYSDTSGCSINTLELTLNPDGPITTTLNETACTSYFWVETGLTYTQSGIYTVPGPALCETILLNLTIIPGSTTTVNESACTNYTWAVNGQSYTQTGSYSAVSGCDTSILNLVIQGSSTQNLSDSACGSYTWSANGVTYTQSGIYTSVSGCDTSILTLNILPFNTTTATDSACVNYTWSVNGQTYTQSGVYTYTSGCDEQVLDLTILPLNTVQTDTTVCDTYTWSADGATYTQSGSYTFPDGCTNNILNLTVVSGNTTQQTEFACGSYFWSKDGVTYTQSGSYTSTSGCDISILNLTITPFTLNSNTVKACGQYVWAQTGDTLTATGVYTDTSGCDIDQLVLEVTPIQLNPTVLTVCDGYVWPVNGQSYTTSGFDTIFDSNACILNTLEVTVVNTVNDTVQVTSCGPYYWAIKDTTYTQTGLYEYLVTDTCQRFVLDLTIEPVVYDTTVKTECTFYTWPVTNQTYFVSGVYTFTPAGSCTTSVLNLTLTTSKPGNPGPISGQATGVCNGVYTYSVSPVARASSYSWSVPNPTQVVILSGQGTNSITVQFNGYTGTGSIAVLASNNCGSSAVRRLTVTSTPARPGTILTNGPVCQGVPVNYAVQPVSGATGYTWSTSIQNVIVSGQGTNTILAVWPFNIQSNQNVSVFAFNACSNSQVRSQNTSVSVCGNRSTVAQSGSAVVFPNPARDRATLQFESTEQAQALISLFDLSGRRLWSSTQAAGIGINRTELDFGSAPSAGVYFVELRIKDAVERIRVIIE